MATDFQIQHEGTIVLLHPLSPSAVDWATENLPSDAQRFGSAIVVEHRYINDIVDGITSDGLTVEG